MNSLEMLMAKPVFQSLGWALVHFIWQGALVAIVYAGVAALLRRRAANVRYMVACLALALMFALPIVTSFVIDSPAPQAATDIFISKRAVAAEPVSVTANTATLSDSQERAVSSGAQVSQAAPSFSWKLWAKDRFTTLLPWLVAIWFAGVLFLSLRFLGGLVITQRLKRRETSLLVEQWQEKLSALCRRLRVSRPVRLCESVLVEVPTVIGWLRPIILVPTSALTGLSAEQLEALLAHELAHVRRYDYLINLLQTAVETLLFYHPAVWWLSSQIRQEREHCCDDLAVATCGDVLTYARALAELEQLRSVAPQLVVAANGGMLMQRIQRLIGSPARTSYRFESWLAGVIALAMVFTILAGAQTRILSNDNQNAAQDSSVASSGKQAAATDNRQRVQSADQKTLGKSADDKSADSLAQPDAAQNNNEPSSDALPAALETTGPSVQAAQDSQSSSSGDFINELAAVGYTNLDVDDLVAFKTHGVTPEFIREMNALFNKKLSADSLVAFRIHGVTAKFMADMKAAGLNNLDDDDLVAFRIHGVTPEYVAGWKAAGYDHLSADDLVAFSIHGVNSAFVQEVTALGFSHPEPDDLVAFKIHGVDAQFVRTMRSYIKGNLSADDLTGMRIHGITPEFIKELEAVGFTNLSADDLTGFRIHGVTPSYIKSIQALGFKPSADDLMGLRVHGVTPEFIETVKSRGFKDVTLEQVIELRRMNIVPGTRKK
jgi:beta-lactamase regulating signal transducer with metallopeptidase domain